jgi:hypothetical protein
MITHLQSLNNDENSWREEEEEEEETGSFQSGLTFKSWEHPSHTTYLFIVPVLLCVSSLLEL